MLAVLASLLLWGCRPASPPESVYQAVYLDYLHGDLEQARRGAAHARTGQARPGSPAEAIWGLRLRLLEAEILLRQERPQEALTLLTGPGTAAPTDGELAIKYALLCGSARARLGETAAGAAQLHSAETLARQRHSGLIAEVLRAEALVALDAGQADQAEEKFHTSLVAARASANALVQASDLVDIGEDSLEDGHYDQALLQLQGAADFAHRAQTRRQLQMALGNMGWAYYNLGDFERALNQFQQAEALAHRIGMTKNRALWLQDAGLAEYKLGNPDAARAYEEQALATHLSLPAGGSAEQVINIETNLALLLLEQGQDGAAHRYLDAAAVKSRQSHNHNVVAYVGYVQGLLARRGGDTQAESLLLKARQTATDPDLRTDIEAAVADLYAARHLQVKAQEWYTRAIQTFETKRAAESDEALRLAAFGFGASVYRRYAQFLVDSQHPEQALQVLDGSRARTLEEGLGGSADARATRAPRPMSARRVARRLNATILFYALGTQHSYLWAITPQAIRLFSLPSERDIQSQVVAYQKSILKSDDPLRAQTAAATALYRMLVMPAAGLIPAHSKVYLVPDGVLHGLNFETLLQPGAQGPRYWIEQATLTTVASIGMLARLRDAAPGATSRQLLLIGNPVAASTGFEALPNASTEMQLVQQHFSPASQTVLTQAHAVPAAYALSAPEQYRYIHFVAHGTASRLSPLDSAVVLSPPADRPDAFKLYAHEILQHPLHAELVTISTCYGSGVRAYAGEGLVGLAWVFLRAGAHHVIGALWQADDASTPLLMNALYEQLQAGRAPDEALHNAKLSLLHSASVYRKPYYWAPFQLYAGA